MERLTLRLRPGMPALTDPAPPPLAEQPPDADRLDDAGLTLEPRRPYRWVFPPGDKVHVTVGASRLGSGERCVLTAWDWELRPVAQTRSSTPCEQALEIEVAGLGTYVLTLDRMAGNQCEARLVRSFSICRNNRAKAEAWRSGGFWVGQCSFPGWQNAVLEEGRPACPPGLSEDESRDLDAELVARMGAGIARINFPVFRRDQSGFDLDFSVADKCVKAFASRGLELDLQLFTPVGPGRGPVLAKYADVPLAEVALYPIRETPYRHFVRQVAERYGRYAAFYQVGNEPGNALQYKGKPDDYVDQVCAAADEIRRVQPDAPITNGGYCSTGPAVREIAGGIRGLTDFASYHWHGDLAGLKTFCAQIQALHREAGYSEVGYANTEMGYRMPTVAEERTNAVVELRKLLWCWAHGHKGVLLYSSRELWWPRQFDYNGIADYGFVDHFFCPRFVYGAVAAFLDRYAGCRFESVLHESENLHVYVFGRGKRRFVTAFAAVTPTEITLASGARDAVIVDPMGNETRAGDPTQVTLTAGEYPQTVELHGPGEVMLVTASLEPVNEATG